MSFGTVHVLSPGWLRHNGDARRLWHGRAFGAPKTGRWSLEYFGGCTGREAKPILVTHLDDNTLIFDDFELRRDDDGQFTGSADFVAPMPADGRDVIYTIAYSLRDVGDGKFAGTEEITEGGGHSLDCPVELVYVGETEA